MLILNDGKRIIENRIVSKNDDKLKEFIEKNRNDLLKNYEVKIPNNHIKSTRVDEIRKYLQYKKLISLYVASQALASSKIDMPIFDCVSSEKNELYLDYIFKNEKEKIIEVDSIDDDIRIIGSLVDNPYFYNILDKMYGDYSGFLEIFPFIEFETTDHCSIFEVNEQYETYLTQKKGGGYISDYLEKMSNFKSAVDHEYAKNNYKILELTKFITKQDIGGK